MDDPRTQLKAMGHMGDNEIPLFETALQLAAIHHTGRVLDPYRHHVKKMQEEVEIRYHMLVSAGAHANTPTKIAALKHILCDQFQYHGAVENYNDMRNADMIEVIDARCGLPISLAILALECAWAQGWDVKGINFPGHFLIRFDDDGQRVLSDPFDQFRIMTAADLRELIKAVIGPRAELSSALYQDISRREILLRLQNNIKFRQIEGEDYLNGLQTVSDMRLFAPHENRLLLDDSVLKARLGRPAEAIESVREYLCHVSNPKDRYDAEMLLRTLETQI